jgi:hypothetical protein
MRRLQTCDQRLQDLFQKVVQYYDCKVLEGHRGEEAQGEAFHAGRSTLHWPQSKHNKLPSLAVDVVPYPVDWEDLDRFRVFGGFVLGVATTMGRIRWGGDWDGDWDFNDQRFVDMPHFELVGAHITSEY